MNDESDLEYLVKYKYTESPKWVSALQIDNDHRCVIEYEEWLLEYSSTRVWSGHVVPREERDEELKTTIELYDRQCSP